MRALLALLMLFSVTARAGVREDHWSGFDFCAGGQPFPAIAGAMLGFNIGDDARVSAGIGTFGRWGTYALDGKFFLSDGEWAPYMGLGLGYMVGTAGTFMIWDLQFDHAFVPYFQGGLDFQSHVGVHVMFNLAGSAPNGRVLVLPGLALGWYF